MNNNTFGRLLDQLLYIANQKKGALAKELGYDTSYISKWITGKNIPTPKNVNKVCKLISSFIVNTLDTTSYQDMINYFGIKDDECDKDILKKYLFRELKEAYLNTPYKGVQKIPKDTKLEMKYNSIANINTKLRKLYLQNELETYLNKCEELDIIISLDLFNANNEERISISDMKKGLAEMSSNNNMNNNVRVRLLTGLEGDSKDIIMDTVILLNMVATHPKLDLEIYNCDITSDSHFFIIKDKILNTSIFNKKGKCIFSTMSKEKEIIDELYYSIEDYLKSQGKVIFEKNEAVSIIKNNIYTQYILGNDLRWLIGSMNELFMPEDLFIEVGKEVFGEDKEILEELRKINIFLNNKTYKSKLKVLIYESELRRYISSGELNFFNMPVKLSFKQREKHIEYMEKLLRENENIDIKVIDGDFIEGYKEDLNPSLYLSKNIKLTTIHPTDDIRQYAVIIDNQFKTVCDKTFDKMWNDRDNITLNDKDRIIENIIEFLSYTKIINANFDDL